MSADPAGDDVGRWGIRNPGRVIAAVVVGAAFGLPCLWALIAWASGVL